MRHTYLTVNLDCFQRNILSLEKHTGKKMMAILKADAYGIGMKSAFLAAKEVGVTYFGVSSIDEAIALRQLDEKVFIQLLGPIDKEDLYLAKKYCLTLMTPYKEYFDDIQDLTDYHISIKLDSGMRRVGLLASEVSFVLDDLRQKGAHISGIFTHFAKSDTDIEFTKKQLSILQGVIRENGPFEMVSCCNSDASLFLKDDVSTHIRCGIALWGYPNRPSYLEETCGLYTHVTNCKKVKKDEGISYGGKYISDGEGYILTVPIGYADGILRSYTGNMVLIGEEEAPIVGTICMDQLMIHTKKDYPIGSRVELFGKHLSLKEFAKRNQTIPYEILCHLSARVMRRYEKGKNVEVYIPRYPYLGE